MRYSVAIPLYNKERHIARAIQSVLSQDNSDFEVVVVDDGSVDDSLRVVEKFADERIRIFQQENSGVSSARNNTIRYARGNYIVFLDADDEWLPNHLESYDEMIAEFPDAGLYATAYETYESSGNVLAPWDKKPYCRKGTISEIDFFRESCQGDPRPVHTSSVCIPMCILDAVGGFNEGCRHGEDLDLWGRIALEYAVIFYCNVSSRRYKDAENRSLDTRPIDRYELPFVTFYKDNRVAIEDKIDNPYISEYVAMQELTVARRLIKCGNRKAAREILSGVKTRHQRKKLIQFYLGATFPTALLKGYLKIKKLKP